jgi:26 proteasome complex subunit DSS1
MSSTANSKTSESSKSAEQPAKAEAQPHLGVLEEDDEFEEFPVAGSFILSSSDTILILF